ncbi:hypothetical protein [Kibdelosporangium philippinense]|uniref:hypothetical protein n=1 Tax=Kibdelosporangium philippinense TaxID=211113 RepID=UPI00360E9A02
MANAWSTTRTTKAGSYPSSMATRWVNRANNSPVANERPVSRSTATAVIVSSPGLLPFN